MSKSFQYVVIFSDDTCPSSEIDEDLTEPVHIGPKTQRGRYKYKSAFRRYITF